MSGRITKVSGPLVVAEGLGDANMADVVRVGAQHLIGEILTMTGDTASIQVYEETGGLGPGAEVVTTGLPLSVELGPGLLDNIYDGIQRPLTEVRKLTGHTIARGVDLPALNRDAVWHFDAVLNVGDSVEGGTIIGTVQETTAILHKIMVPVGVSGVIEEIASGDYKVTDTVAKVKKADGSIIDVSLMQRWPVRINRPYKQKFTPSAPLNSGQRVIDTMFPLAKGGTAAVPGPFGSGKTVVQHQLAKWSDVDVVVYIGCGERGNEMTDVLKEFPELHDPRTGLSLMKRTVLIANTSDMPVAAREASIYTGITIAEYFRDMGYKAAIIADSTSRWAEALREMSGRLEEMPGEEGYPAYLSTRLAEFYERAGAVICNGKDNREGAVTAIGAVSPPGGDTSEPVSQATLRIVKVFWGLSAELAYQRHFPAIDWLKSYSLYDQKLGNYFTENIDENWSAQVAEVKFLLQQEAELNEIVRLVGFDALSEKDRLTLDCARLIREDFLQQDSFREVDTYTPPKKQAQMIAAILGWYHRSRDALRAGAEYRKIINMGVLGMIARMKYEPDNKWDGFYEELDQEMRREFAEIRSGGDAA
jgi:V/A-type H+-transporting ATPase subunit A